MIVFRTPEGVDVSGGNRRQKVRRLLAFIGPDGGHGQPEHIKILEQWMKSYQPEELFDAERPAQGELAEMAPAGRAV